MTIAPSVVSNTICSQLGSQTRSSHCSRPPNLCTRGIFHLRAGCPRPAPSRQSRHTLRPTPRRRVPAVSSTLGAGAHDNVVGDVSATALSPITLSDMECAPPSWLIQPTPRHIVPLGIAHLDQRLALRDTKELGPVAVDDEVGDREPIAALAVGAAVSNAASYLLVSGSGSLDGHSLLLALHDQHRPIVPRDLFIRRERLLRCRESDRRIEMVHRSRA